MSLLDEETAHVKRLEEVVNAWAAKNGLSGRPLQEIGEALGLTGRAEWDYGLRKMAERVLELEVNYGKE